MNTKDNILKFNKSVILDLTEETECGYDAIVCGKNKFTLRDFRKQEGHDDSLPYYGILCSNGKQLCECVNDGWGGVTEMKPISIVSRAMIEAIKLNLKNYKWSYRDTTLDVTLDFVADMLAINEYNKLRKTLKGKYV